MLIACVLVFEAGSPKRDRQMSFEHAFRRAPIKLLLTTWIDLLAYIGGTSLHTRRILLLFFVWPSQTMPEQTIITYLYAKTGIHIFIAEYFDTARPSSTRYTIQQNGIIAATTANANLAHL